MKGQTPRMEPPPPDEPGRSSVPRVSVVPKGPPGSFSRIFLGGLEKYRKLTGRQRDVGSPAEDAAAALAQKGSPDARRAASPVARLRSPRAALETLLITAIVPVIGWLIDRRDPFFLAHAFSWLMLAPLLIALRHGFTFGFTSAVLLDAAISVAWRTHAVPMSRFPSETFVGLLGLAMLAGQFSDVWKREIVRLDSGFDHMRRQIDQLSRVHFLLELSHNRLEQQTARAAPSLRQALGAARALANAKGATLETMADSILETFASYCMVEVAALFGVSGGRVYGPPTATIGRPDLIDPDDPLVVAAMRSSRLAYMPHALQDDTDASASSSLLAALPLVDTTGTVHAVLCVRAMPFFAFETRNLEALSLLGGHFADLLASRGRATDLERGRRHEFEISLLRAVRDAEEFNVPNMVATLVIHAGSPIGGVVDMLLGGSLEELEFPYVFQDEAGSHYVFILLPMTDEKGARALKDRLEGIAMRELRMPLNAAGAFFSVHRLTTRDNLAAILRLLGEEKERA